MTQLLKTSPPSYNSLENSEPSKYEKIQNLIKKYEIDPYFSEHLDILSNCEIVLLCDDSGSMNNALDDHTAHNTRWEELKSVVEIVVSIATIYDENGIEQLKLSPITISFKDVLKLASD